MHRLSAVDDGLVATAGFSLPYSLLFLGRPDRRAAKVVPTTSNNMTQTTSASPGNTASHHSPADR